MAMRIRVIFSVIILFVSSVIFAGNDISSLPGASTLIGKEEAGYLPASKKTKLFYWFVASHQPNAPLVIWANGGPGYSSFYGFFKETGPYVITKNLQLKPRKNGWNNFANYLVIEQPGIGFSLMENNLLPKNRDQAVTQYYNALISFLKAHPQYANSPLYLAGESYAGTMLPLVAKKMVEDKSANLKGLILMSPWIDPKKQVSADTDYAMTHGLITQTQAQKVDAMEKSCVTLIAEKKYRRSDVKCDAIDGEISHFSQVALANIAYTDSDDNTYLDRYLSQSAVQKALHVESIKDFHCWSSATNRLFIPEIDRSVKSIYEFLLENKMPVLIFSGLNDAKDTNFLGMKKTVGAFDWSSKADFSQARKKVLIKGDHVIGYEKSGGGLTWILVRNAGHMVARDQPDTALYVKAFMKKNS